MSRILSRADWLKLHLQLLWVAVARSKNVLLLVSTLAGIEAVKIWSVHYLVSTYWLESVDSVGNMSASSVHWCWVTQVYWAALRCPALKWPVSSSS